MSNKYWVDAAKFLLHVSTLDKTPAGEALIKSNPAVMLKVVIDQAKAIRKEHSLSGDKKPDGEEWDWPVWS